MNSCTVCFKPQTPLVDAMLIQGVTIAEVARRTGLSRQAIGRHQRKRHVIRPKDPVESEVKGWELQGFATEDAWLAALAADYGLALADLKAHIAAGHHLA